MSIKDNPYKAILNKLNSGQRQNLFLTRLLYGLVLANVMIHNEVLLYILPCILLPLAVFSGAKIATRWHISQYTNGAARQEDYSYTRLYRHAAVAGIGFSAVMFFLPAIASYFLCYLATIGGICLLVTIFFKKGFINGWNSVVDQEQVAPAAARSLQGMNIVLALFSLSMLFTIIGFSSVVLSADAAEQAQETQEAPDSLALAMSGGSSAQQVQEPQAEPAVTSAPTAPVAKEAAVTAASQSAIPADNPEAIGAMEEFARKGVIVDPRDPMVDQDTHQLTTDSLPLWAGKERNDGYPNYAVTCALANDTCSQLNGMGQPVTAPIESLGAAVTIMRNADVQSGRYHCGHGICVDAEFNLVGRISPAMLTLHPDLYR